MIIYSENILCNNSGIPLNIFTQDENNHNYNQNFNYCDIPSICLDFSKR